MNKKTFIHKNVPYQVENIDKQEIILTENESVKMLDLKSKDVLTFNYKDNKYYVYNPKLVEQTFSFCVNVNKNLISINYGDDLKVYINGKLELQEFAPDIEYKNYEIIKEVAVFYFEGKRNFVVIVEKDKIKQAMFYDEFNKHKLERWFMSRLYDSLNHGKVVHISDESVDNYLVYLDENSLELKDTFVANVFLDCVACGNFKYCNNLLCEELKQQDENHIKSFFKEFDSFYSLDENVFALIKKNTLSGIYKFEINNMQLENITLL